MQRGHQLNFFATFARLPEAEDCLRYEEMQWLLLLWVEISRWDDRYEPNIFSPPAGRSSFEFVRF